MLDLTKIPENILKDIKQMCANPMEHAVAIDFNVDEYLNKLTPREALDKYLTWNGIVGHTEMILDAWNALQKAETGTFGDANQTVYDFAKIPEGEFHNPENIDEKTLPKGRRFFLVKEAKYFQKLGTTTIAQHLYIKFIKACERGNLTWWGNSPEMTYHVPIEFRIKELGEY